MKKILLLVAIIAAIGTGYYIYNQRQPDSESQSPSSNEETEIPSFNRNLHSIDEPGSIWWIVNKNRPLPDDYVPTDLTAPDIRLRWDETAESMQVREVLAKPLEDLYAAAREAEQELMLISGYRSHEYQKELYDNYVRQYGQEEADRFSAKPGTSEHQTGLVIDLGRVDGECEIQECFGETAEGKWLANNAYKYGFIIRYLEDKEDSTGYMYEPWHLRYVGTELAAELHHSGRTMEEFFGLQ